MRTHPAIAALLRKPHAQALYQKALHEADQADKADRVWHGPGKRTTAQVIDAMHADLIKAGAHQINGMPADVWLLRALRELRSVS